jgi:hypothetical protein
MWRSKRIDSADWLESMAEEEETLPETSENMSEKEAFELAQGQGMIHTKKPSKEWRP